MSGRPDYGAGVLEALVSCFDDVEEEAVALLVLSLLLLLLALLVLLPVRESVR